MFKKTYCSGKDVVYYVGPSQVNETIVIICECLAKNGYYVTLYCSDNKTVNGVEYRHYTFWKCEDHQDFTIVYNDYQMCMNVKNSRLVFLDSYSKLNIDNIDNNNIILFLRNRINYDNIEILKERFHKVLCSPTFIKSSNKPIDTPRISNSVIFNDKETLVKIKTKFPEIDTYIINDTIELNMIDMCMDDNSETSIIAQMQGTIPITVVNNKIIKPNTNRQVISDIINKLYSKESIEKRILYHITIFDRLNRNMSIDNCI